MDIQRLQCPQCGGALAPSAHVEGVLTCGYCGAHALLERGQAHQLGRLELPERHPADELRATMLKRLRYAGLPAPPPLEEIPGSVRYLVRRGRVRVTPRPRGDGANAGFVPQYEQVREGLFGVPLSGERDLALVYLEDLEALDPAHMPLPEHFEDDLLRFDDRVRVAAVRAREKAISAEAGAMTPAFGGYDVTTAWHDDVYLLDIPTIEFRFTFTGTANTLWKAWSDVRADGRYGAIYNRHDGAVLQWRAPRQGPNWVTIIVGVILVTFVLPMLGALAVTFISVLFAVILPLLFAAIALIAA